MTQPLNPEQAPDIARFTQARSLYDSAYTWWAVIGGLLLAVNAVFMWEVVALLGWRDAPLVLLLPFLLPGLGTLKALGLLRLVFSVVGLVLTTRLPGARYGWPVLALLLGPVVPAVYYFLRVQPWLKQAETRAEIQPARHSVLGLNEGVLNSELDNDSWEDYDR